MQVYEIAVTGRAVHPNGADTTLVRTSIGVDQLHVLFDSSEWLAFPVKVTFANADETKVTASLTLAAVTSTEWAAEATVTVPWEVLQTAGGLELTFQGTDSSGNHIITEASGTPLTVVEAGDVADGTIPEGAPTQSEWEQAYADAMSAVNQANSVVENIESQIDEIVAEAEDEIHAAAGAIQPATTETLGVVMVGEGLSVDEDGLLSADETNGMTPEQAAALANLRRLAAYDFVSVFDDDGTLTSATVNPTALPIATSTTRGAVQPDGDSIEVGASGTLSIKAGWIDEQLSTLDGALKWKGTAESVEDLPDDASVGDVYIVQGSTLFWDGEEWAEISTAVDLSGYVEESDVHEVTPAEVHEITSRSSSWAQLRAYVTQESLDASLEAHKQQVEGDVEEMLEAMVNGAF